MWRRKRLSEGRTKVKQKIKGFLLASGIDEPASIRQWSVDASKDLTELKIPESHRMTLASLVREYLFLLSEEKQIRKEIRELTNDLHAEAYERLISVTGVGEAAASYFLAELFSPERFNRLEEVASYLGLAPIVSQSGNSTGKARIRSVGQKRLRSVLVEVAW